MAKYKDAKKEQPKEVFDLVIGKNGDNYYIGEYIAVNSHGIQIKTFVYNRNEFDSLYRERVQVEKWRYLND